jgi:hypothetical protein
MAAINYSLIRNVFVATQFDKNLFFTCPLRGNSVPQVLIEKAEGYLPPNMDLLIKFVKVTLQFSFLYMRFMSNIRLNVCLLN